MILLLGILIIGIPSNSSKNVFIEESLSKGESWDTEWNISSAVQYIAQHQRVDGGFGDPGNPSYLNLTSMVIAALGWIGKINSIDLDGAINFITLCYIGDGFGNTIYPESPDLLSTWLSLIHI